MVTARRSKKNLFRIIPMITALIMFLFVSGCGSSSSSQGGKEEMVIAVQPGLGYAPITVVKQMGWLEKDLPDVKITWKKLASGAAIRDGMLAGEIHVGSGGIGPFLLGWDKGVDWKVLTSLLDSDLWLMVKDPRIQSLKDFKPQDKIAMPGLDSIQSVVLRKGAQEQLGDPKVLDKNMVALEHPTAMQALLSDQIAGHLTAPPFQLQEKDKGARVILRSYDLFGVHTFNSVWVREDYYNDHPEAMDALYRNIQRAIELLNNDPDKAAEILSKESGGNPSVEEYKKWITQDFINYTTEPHGFIKFAEVMKELGMINKVPASCKEILHDKLGNPSDC